MFLEPSAWVFQEKLCFIVYLEEYYQLQRDGECELEWLLLIQR